MRNRAYRRHTEERQKKRVKRYIKETWSRTCGDLSQDPKRIGKQAHIHGLCSCAMCGNPRKYFNEKTKQEPIADISNRQALEDAARECEQLEDAAFIERARNIFK